MLKNHYNEHLRESLLAYLSPEPEKWVREAAGIAELTKRQMEVYKELKKAPAATMENGKITNFYYDTYQQLDGTINYQHPKGEKGNFKDRTLLAIERAGLIEIVSDTSVRIL